MEDSGAFFVLRRRRHRVAFMAVLAVAAAFVLTSCQSLTATARIAADEPTAVVIASTAGDLRRVSVRVIAFEDDGYPVPVEGALLQVWDTIDGWQLVNKTGKDGTAVISGRGTFEVWLTVAEQPREKRVVMAGSKAIDLHWKVRP